MKGFGQSHQRKYSLKGNILFSTLMLFLVCTSLMLMVVEAYRLTMDINQRTKKYYIAKVMKQMFLSEVNELNDQGMSYYSSGTISYEKSEQVLNLQIKVFPFIFEFTENLNNDTDNNTDED